VSPDAALALCPRPRRRVIDWSERAEDDEDWNRPGTRSNSRVAGGAPWVRDFVLEPANEDPNADLEAVLPGDPRWQ